MKISKILPLIGIAIFVYIIYLIGIDSIVTTFKNIKLAYIPLIIILLFIEFWFLTYKWKKIIELQGFNISFKEAFKYYMMGTFYGFITPSRAGSLIRATYLKKKTDRTLVECASGIVIERVFDLLALTILAALGAIYVANYFAGILPTVLLVLIGLVATGIFFASKRRARFVLRFFYKLLIPNRFKERARDSFNIFYSSIPKIRKLIYPFILTMITWILANTVLYVMALMFQISIPYWIFIILVPISTVVGMVPITMSGLGTREATLIGLFKIFDVSSELTLSMSLTALIIGAAIPALIGFLLTLKRS